MSLLSGCFSATPVAKPPPTKKPLNILFVGNSFTFMPDWDNPTIPAFVQALLNSKDISVHIDKVLASGHTLANHWNECKFQKALENQHYDFVFIQPFSIEAMELPSCFEKFTPPGYAPDSTCVQAVEPKDKAGPHGRKHFLLYAKKMIDLVRSKGATPIVIEPHIYDDGHPWLQDGFECRKFPGTQNTWWGGSEDEFQKREDEGYTVLQQETGVELLRIGPLWNQVRHAHDFEMPVSVMYQQDHYHQSYVGALLAALVIASRLSNIPTTQFDFCPAKVTRAQEQYLEKLAEKNQVRFTKASH